MEKVRIKPKAFQAKKKNDSRGDKKRYFWVHAVTAFLLGSVSTLGTVA